MESYFSERQAREENLPYSARKMIVPDPLDTDVRDVSDSDTEIWEQLMEYALTRSDHS